MIITTICPFLYNELYTVKVSNFRSMFLRSRRQPCQFCRRAAGRKEKAHQRAIKYTSDPLRSADEIEVNGRGALVDKLRGKYLKGTVQVEKGRVLVAQHSLPCHFEGLRRHIVHHTTFKASTSMSIVPVSSPNQATRKERPESVERIIKTPTFTPSCLAAHRKLSIKL